MARFALEIGTEEIPARFLQAEQTALVRLFSESLAEAGLPHGDIRVLATPRRLGMIVEDVAENQVERDDLIIGPPASIAYDAQGNPTRALLGFAVGNDVAPESVFRHTTEKGEYVACRKKGGGKTALKLLAEISPTVIEAIPYGKRMKWGNNAITHARPIRWIMALLDDQLVPFTVGPVESARVIQGHRVHGNGPKEVPSASRYMDILQGECGVIPELSARRAIIIERGNNLAQKVSGQVLWDESLLDEVSGLVEHPVPLLGDFDKKYLEMPQEVLLTSMEEHQKSFGIVDSAGRLLPHFLTVLNIEPRNYELVKHGWEKVLKARLEDARFFWQSDLQETFDNWLKKLDNVIFLGPLGSMGEKSRRLAKLSQWLANELSPQDLTPADAERAGLLAKADLVSAMVGEFDTLQGIMGGIYAEKAGENAAVSKAIREQYLPTGPDTQTPQTTGGCILAIADKADTLAGCFGLSQIPTGAADPNGLRRAALGIIRILLDKDWQIAPADIFSTARKLYGDKKWKLDEDAALDKLMEFFRGRMRNYFISQGYDTILVDAALAAGEANPADVKARLDALAAFTRSPNYLQSAQLMKRIDNIARKSALNLQGNWDDTLLEEDAEKNLALKIGSAAPVIDQALAARDYARALATLEEIRPVVDAFFDNVLVMSDNPAVRDNRLRLLQTLARPYGRIARFSMLQV